MQHFGLKKQEVEAVEAVEANEADGSDFILEAQIDTIDSTASKLIIITPPVPPELINSRIDIDLLVGVAKIESFIFL